MSYALPIGFFEKGCPRIYASNIIVSCLTNRLAIARAEGVSFAYSRVYYKRVRPGFCQYLELTLHSRINEIQHDFSALPANLAVARA